MPRLLPESTTTETRVLLLGEKFAKLWGQQLSVVSLWIFRDTMGFERLRQGKSLLVNKADYAVAFFSTFWPPGEPWPEHLGLRRRPMLRPEDLHWRTRATLMSCRGSGEPRLCNPWAEEPPRPKAA
jgi:hypothetical protein